MCIPIQPSALGFFSDAIIAPPGVDRYMGAFGIGVGDIDIHIAGLLLDWLAPGRPWSASAPETATAKA